MIGDDEAALQVVARRRAALTAEFGWTHVEVRLAWDGAARALRLRGQVAAPRVRAALQTDLAPLLPRDWRVVTDDVALLPGLGWRALRPGVTRLWRTPQRVEGAGAKGHVAEDSLHHGAAGLTSELLAGDGPVELLHALPGALLVRASDGAVGWVRGLGSATAGPRAEEPRRWTQGEALRRLAASLRGYRGVQYRLGGTTRRHMDCSGLVQRCVREALGRVLPRHSTEQVGGDAAGRALGEPGDLVFMAGVGATGGHVGVVLRGDRPGERTLVHASTSRGRVIEEPLDRCLARAPGGVRHAELAQVIEGRVL